MTKHVIVGAGPVGSAVARRRVAAGDDVWVVTRSGRECPGATAVAMDAADAEALSSVAEGAAVIYNCANPSDYGRWAQQWPPMASAMVTAAKSSGAGLVIAGNLYGYGPVDGPMRPDLPLRAHGAKGRVRAQMWHDALNGTGGRAAEVRGSDYVGPGAQSHVNRQLEAIRTGRTARVIGDPDQPHSWTYTEDMAAALAAIADRPELWGRAWHAPVTATTTQREACNALAEAIGREDPKVVGLPSWQLALAGLFNSEARSVKETAYQFEAPFVCDDTETLTALGIEATPWPEVIAATWAGEPVRA